MVKAAFLAIALFGTAFTATAQDVTSHAIQMSSVQTPTQSVRATVDQLIATISTNELSQAQKREQIEALVDSGMDLKASAQRVLAVYWKKTKAEDRQDFILLFKQVLINTYFSLLNKYNDEQVNYLNETIRKGRFATVNTEVIHKGIRIPVQYKMLKRKDKWRIYDVRAEGISMVSSFNKDYKRIIRTQGVSGLNKAIATKLDKQKQTQQQHISAIANRT